MQINVMTSRNTIRPDAETAEHRLYAITFKFQTTAIATDLTATTVTGDGMFESYFGFVVNAAGTFIPQFAKNTDATGTATVYANSHMLCKDLP